MAGDGSGQTAQVIEGPIHGADAIGVTVEPAGGSTAPTTEPVVSVPI
jgi:anti-sigma-K factor RskA